MGSPSTGPDRVAVAQVSAIVAKYEMQMSKPIASKRIPWGWEGEFVVCFPLPELSVAVQAAFVDDVKTTIRSHMVKIEENVICGTKTLHP